MFFITVGPSAKFSLRGENFALNFFDVENFTLNYFSGENFTLNYFSGENFALKFFGGESFTLNYFSGENFTLFLWGKFCTWSNLCFSLYLKIPNT